MAKITTYSTKYWETLGVLELKDCELNETDGRTYVSRGQLFSQPNYVFQRLGNGIFLTRDEAVADATQKAKRKLVALERQRTKILAQLQEWKS